MIHSTAPEETKGVFAAAAPSGGRFLVGTMLLIWKNKILRFKRKFLPNECAFTIVQRYIKSFFDKGENEEIQRYILQVELQHFSTEQVEQMMLFETIPPLHFSVFFTKTLTFTINSSISQMFPLTIQKRFSTVTLKYVFETFRKNGTVKSVTGDGGEEKTSFEMFLDADVCR